jgi:GT2 family glycosyltransferase
MRAMAEQVDRFLAPSDDARRRHIRFGIGPDRIVRHEQGIPPWTPVERSARTGPLRIGFFGSLIPAKGIDVLLEAFRRLPSGLATLEAYGSLAPYHDDTAAMRRTAALLNWPGIAPPRTLPRELVIQTMASLDLVVVPSIWPENAPFVIREAFAAGVPVLASAIGGIPELVRDGMGGWLIEPRRVDALARTLHGLAADRSRLTRLKPPPSPLTIDQDAVRTRGHYEDLRRNKRSRTAAARPRVAAVVLNYQTPAETMLAVNAVRASNQRLDDVIVVDNGSTDGGEALRRALPGIRVLASEANLGFAGGVNVGVRHALTHRAEAVLLLNSDVITPPDALDLLLADLAATPEVGIVGPTLVSRSEPDLVASRGMRFSERTARMIHVDHGRRRDRADLPQTLPVDAVSGCAMLVRRDVFERIGLFDESYFFGYEDLDFCLRARDAGFSTWCSPRAIAYHEGGVSLDRRSPKRIYYGARNHLRLATGRAPSAGSRAVRAASVLLFSTAYVLRDPSVPLGPGIVALGLGVRDHFLGRYGPG